MLSSGGYDGVLAMVIDVGSHTTRIGYGGEDCPKQLWNSCVGYSKPSLGYKDPVASLKFPLCFYNMLAHCEVKPCVGLYEDGQHFLNEDVFEKIVAATCEGRDAARELVKFRQQKRENGGSSDVFGKSSAEVKSPEMKNTSKAISTDIHASSSSEDVWRLKNNGRMHRREENVAISGANAAYSNESNQEKVSSSSLGYHTNAMKSASFGMGNEGGNLTNEPEFLEALGDLDTVESMAGNPPSSEFGHKNASAASSNVEKPSMVFGLGSELSEHPVLLSEPSKHSKKFRYKMAEVMFEGFNVPSMYLAKRAALSVFATGRSSGLIVDIGANITSICPVTDGYVVGKDVIEYPIGGNSLDMQFSRILTEQKIPIYPFFGTKKVIRGSSGNMPSVVKVDCSQVSPSYLLYSQYESVRSVRETMCRVTEDPDVIASYNGDEKNRLHTGMPLSIVPGSNIYELPDGTRLDSRFYSNQVPEILFNPSLIKFPVHNLLQGFEGLPDTIAKCIQASDNDVKKELLNAIILTGGTSLMPGLYERTISLLQSNETLLGGTTRFRVVPASASSERRFSSWIGGSILASLGSFHQMWLSAEEYNEHGSHVVDRKCA